MMKPPVDVVRVSNKGKDTLIKIKRNTGLQHWNVICRIALCTSLAEPSPPPERGKGPDSNIEMDWKTFAGPYQDELAALIKYKLYQDNIKSQHKNNLADYIKNHIEYGIMLISKIKF